MHFKSLAAAAAAGTVAAQNPPSFCDKYTAALFKDNSAANQLKLLTAVVNTAVIGNYTESKTGTAVPGILAPAVVDGKAVNLLPYFNGCLASTNAGGTPKAVNFLDDGGAAPLMMDKPSNSSGSRQYMNLDHAEVTYFIEQVASAALSFGVDPADLGPVGLALDQLFNYKCLPATEPVPGQGKQLQSICSAQSCPILPSSNCGAYSNITDPLSVCPDDAISSNKTTIIIVTGKKCPTTCTSATCQCMHGPVVVDGDEYDNDEEDESGSGSNEEDADEESVDGSSGEGSDNPSSGSILGPGASNSTGNNGAVPGSGSANTSGSGAGASNYTGNAGANPGSGSGSTSGSGAGAGAGANSGSGSSSGSDSGSGSSSDSIAGSGSGSSGPEVVSTAMASAFGMSLAAILAGSLAVFFYL
ncbi:hypothetical protein PZA11_002930 [Diplocarpon coronariae]